MKQLAPSILAADFNCLGEQLQRLEQSGIQYLHIDVMDGMFVPSISFGMPVIKSLRDRYKMFFDVHLMVEEPIRYIEAFRKAGADGITVHVEACEDLTATLKKIREVGAKPAVSLCPETAVKEIIPVLNQVDMVLVMSVHPGFGGQTLMPDTLNKIEQLKKLREEKGLSYTIEIDGGVTRENIREVASYGVDIIVAGTAVFRGDIAGNIDQLQTEISMEGHNAS
ncbi:MAG: ribulose-phosphate 3-epimerase [Lachnospiraceae bacterium]|nr:ribulose-phosphate 3-epimerase [Lachnospiraceae bacterium]